MRDRAPASVRSPPGERPGGQAPGRCRSVFRPAGNRTVDAVQSGSLSGSVVTWQPLVIHCSVTCHPLATLVFGPKSRCKCLGRHGLRVAFRPPEPKVAGSTPAGDASFHGHAFCDTVATIKAWRENRRLAPPGRGNEQRIPGNARHARRSTSHRYAQGRKRPLTPVGRRDNRTGGFQRFQRSSATLFL